MQQNSNKDMESRQNAAEENRKRGHGIFAAIGIAAVAAGAIYLAPHLSQQFASSGSEPHEAAPIFKEYLTAEILKERILKQCKLVTYTHEDTVKVSDSDNINIPFTDYGAPGLGREFSITVPVTVDLTTDLDQMEIELDSAAQAASIVIPCSKIFRITSDVENIEADEDIGIFRSKMTAEEQKWLIVRAEEEAENKVEANDVYVTANERAGEIIKSIAKDFGVKYVDISIK